MDVYWLLKSFCVLLIVAFLLLLAGRMRTIDMSYYEAMDDDPSTYLAGAGVLCFILSVISLMAFIIMVPIGG